MGKLSRSLQRKSPIDEVLIACLDVDFRETAAVAADTCPESLLGGRLLHLLEPHKVVFFQREFLFPNELETCLFDLPDDHFLPGSDVAQYPFGTLALDAVEIDDDDLPTRPQGFVD